MNSGEIYHKPKNMKQLLLGVWDKLMRKRVLVEPVIDQLKNVSQIEQSRYRGVQS